MQAKLLEFPQQEETANTKFRAAKEAEIVETATEIAAWPGYSAEDFFIYAISVTADFAYSAFKNHIFSMADTETFILVSNEPEGNLCFRGREGYVHDGRTNFCETVMEKAGFITKKS